MKELAGRLFNLLPPLDVIDPESFVTETILILSGYPDVVVERAVHEIPRRSDRPTLRLIKAVCEEIFEPIEREIRRRDVAEARSRQLEPPRRKRTPDEQTRVDAQVLEAKRQFSASLIDRELQN